MAEQSKTGKTVRTAPDKSSVAEKNTLQETKAKKTSAGKNSSGRSLVIVESPTKQKTISRFLDGKYVVRSSFGHVRDLPANEIGVDEGGSFAARYVVVDRAKKILSELTTIAKRADMVYLATDPDREGEAISWHLMEMLKSTGVPFKRISFHEITRSAIEESLKSPRDLDMNLVNAQQARRIIDRLVGYKLSPLLWSKIKSGLSAGRVQSVAVRLVSERAREIAAFNEEEYYTFYVMLAKGQTKAFPAKLVKWNGRTVEQSVLLHLFAEDYRYKTSPFKKLEDTAEAATLLKQSVITVTKVDSKTVKQKPKPPFITSTLQQDAYNKLGFSSDRTMRIAQALYEGVELKNRERSGLITYMRTDSFNVSAEMQKETAKFIASTYGREYCPARPPLYLKKVKGAQEAHESIHPTSVYRRPEEIAEYLTAEQLKLYTLIWNRFVASQMNAAEFDSLTAEFSDEKAKAVLRAGGRALKFDGYLKVYREEKEDDVDSGDENSAILPPLKVGDEVTLKDISARPHKTTPPPNYNEASLIKTLEKHGIGRPSTYAAIIKNITDRGYITKEKGKMLITGLGTLVTEKLKEFFKDIMEISYTASIEDKLDDIADGGVDWVKMMSDFYRPFSEELKAADKNMERTRPGVQKTDEKCPICLSPMYLRESRYGKYLSCSRFPKCKGKIPLDREGNKQEVFNPVKTDRICDKCGKNHMLLRKSTRGYFLACSGFPKCRNAQSVSQEEVDRILDHKKA
ncbi:MAG: type I DNA topoisomerase [Elusimicrobiales bacterium]|nr:type I DNA topoisomerase [Elusimicrobiales bacterium]